MKRNRLKYRIALRVVGALLAAWVLALVMIEMSDHPNESVKARTGYDFWRHAANVASVQLEWDSGTIPHPSGYKSGMFYIHVVGGFAAAFDFLPHRALWMAGWLNLLLLVGGVWCFSRILMGPRVAFGVVVLVCMAFWGDQEWVGNIPYLLLLPKVIANPAGFAFALSLWSLSFLYFAMNTESEKKRRMVCMLLVSIVSGVMVILSHVPTTWMFFLPMSGLMWLIMSFRRWRIFVIWLVGVCFMTMLWPAWEDVTINRISGYLRAELVHDTKSEGNESAALEDTSESSESGKTKTDAGNSFKAAHAKYYDIEDLLDDAPALVPGTVLLVLAAIFRRKSRRMRFLIISAAFFLIAWFLCGFVFGIMMGHRYIFLYGFMMQLAAVKWLWELSAHRRWWLSILVVIALSPVMRDSLNEAWEKYLEERGEADIASNELVKVQAVTQQDRVLTAESTAFILPAFRINSVWQGRTNMYGVPDVLADWYSDPTSSALRQAAHGTGARWLLVWRPEMNDMWIPDPEAATLDMDEYLLFALPSIAD